MQVDGQDWQQLYICLGGISSEEAADTEPSRCANDTITTINIHIIIVIIVILPHIISINIIMWSCSTLI